MIEIFQKAKNWFRQEQNKVVSPSQKQMYSILMYIYKIIKSISDCNLKGPFTLLFGH